MGQLPDETRLRPMSPVPPEERNDDQGSRALVAVKALVFISLLGAAGIVVVIFVVVASLLREWFG